MKKLLFALFGTSLLLVGCQQEETKETAPTEETEKAAPEQTKPEAKPEGRRNGGMKNQ